MHRQAKGLAASALNIGVIGDVGKAKEDNLVDTWTKRGVLPIQSHHVCQALGYQLATGLPTMGATGGILLSDYFRDAPALLAALVNEGQLSRARILLPEEELYALHQSLQGEAGLMNALEEGDYDTRVRIVQEEIESLVAALLGGSFNVAKSLADCGVDSLMASRLASRIELKFDKRYRPEDLFLIADSTTVATVAHACVGTMFPENSEEEITAEAVLIQEASILGDKSNPEAPGARPEDWIETHRVENESMVLVCFPPNGMGPRSFNGWPAEYASKANATVVCVKLPGWQGREDEPVLDDLQTIVMHITHALGTPSGVGGVGHDGKPRAFTMFGHSMGGLIAYHVAFALQESYGLVPQLLIVSAWASPTRRYDVPDSSAVNSTALLHAPRAEAMKQLATLK